MPRTWLSSTRYIVTPHSAHMAQSCPLRDATPGCYCLASVCVSAPSGKVARAVSLCFFVCTQVEGVVADYDLSLGDLIGVIAEFFRRIGITELRFKPAYNPYTEPSMEVFGYHPDLKKWTEIGNSGIFRPEMLRPMGLPENVRVIAWGLSLERPTMIKHRIKNIRDLFGHKVKFDMSRSAPIVRF